MTFGKVKQGDFDKLLKGGYGGDQVPTGDYVVAGKNCRHTPPSEKTNGMGLITIQTVVTDDNQDEVGSTLEHTFRYDPNPQTDGRAKMNSISEENMAKLIDAAGEEPVVDDDGYQDLIATLEQILPQGCTFTTEVTHRTYQDRNGDPKVAQDLTNFRPAP